MILDKNFLNFITHISVQTSTLPVIMGLLRFKKIKGFYIPLLSILIISIIIELINFILAQNLINTYPIYKLYTLLELTFLSAFYAMYFQSERQKKLIKFVTFLFPIISLIDLYLNGWDKMDVLSTSIESIILICYSTYYFHSLSNNSSIEKLTEEPTFWINTGILFYFAGNFFIFLFNNYMLELNRIKHDFL